MPLTPSPPAHAEHRHAWEYIAPIGVFSVFTALEGYAPLSTYPLLYTLKVCAVTITLLAARGTLRDIRPSSSVLPLAIVVGIAVFVEWIAIDQWVPYPHIGTRVGFDPFAFFQSPVRRSAFLAVRLYGLVLMVPVMEELFLRSFLLRSVISHHFNTVRVGQVSREGLWFIAAVSAVGHPEWVVAIIASLAYTLLLHRTRSLFATVVAHAVTNGAIGVYVLTTHHWQYW